MNCQENKNWNSISDADLEGTEAIQYRIGSWNEASCDLTTLRH